MSSPTRSGSWTWEQWPTQEQHLGLYSAVYLSCSCPEKIYSRTSSIHGPASVFGTTCCPPHAIEPVPTVLGTQGPHPSETSMSQLPQQGAHRHHPAATLDLVPLSTPYNYFTTTFPVKSKPKHFIVDYTPYSINI